MIEEITVTLSLELGLLTVESLRSYARFHMHAEQHEWKACRQLADVIENAVLAAQQANRAEKQEKLKDEIAAAVPRQETPKRDLGRGV